MAILQRLLGLRRSIFCLVLISLACSQFLAGGEPPTVAELIKHWRKAVHAKNHHDPVAAVLVTQSTEDSIPGQITEFITSDGGYKQQVSRGFDESEVVVSRGLAARRDWNGFIRQIEGAELTRLRARILEVQILAFGPPPPSAGDQRAAATLDAGDGLYRAKLSDAEGVPVTWYIDPKTWLPRKSVRAGEDSIVTTIYGDSPTVSQSHLPENWKDIGNGVLTAIDAKVTETDKPDFSWRRTSIKAAPVPSFDAPKPGPSDVHMSADTATIAFTLEANHIVFPVSVNGRPPIGFLLDTGADQEVINAARLENFGLHTYAKSMTTGGGNSAEYSYAANATFTLPGVELNKQHVAVIDQTGLEQALGIPLGGLLGYDFISRFVVEIDYEKHLLTLHDPRRWEYVGKGFVVPLTFDNGIPFMHGKISVPTKPDIPAFFVLDGGAAETMTLTSPFVRANDLARLAQTNSAVNRPSGLEKQFFAQNNVRGHIDRLQLASLSVKNIPINMSVNTKGAYASESFSGTVGEGIFTRYHVFLDYTRKRAIFEPTPEADKPFPERLTYGATFLASGPDLHQYNVVAVRPGTAAEHDGFKKGDQILSVDGKPSSGFLLSELRATLSRAGEHHEIVVQRDNASVKLNAQIALVSIDSR